MRVCPNKRIKGPLCLWEDEWRWGRDLGPSLSLWADPAFESCGAGPTRTDGLQSSCRLLSLSHYLPFTPRFDSCRIQRASILTNSGLKKKKKPPVFKRHWDFEEIKNIFLKKISIYPVRCIQKRSSLGVFSTTNKSTATQSVHACPRQTKIHCCYVFHWHLRMRSCAIKSVTEANRQTLTHDD